MTHHTPSPHAVTFPQLDRQVEILGGETVFHCARRHGVRIVGACGGRGACGTCTIRVVHGRVAHIADGAEVTDDAPDRRRKWMRACQVTARGDLTVEVAPRSLAPVVRAEANADGAAEILPLDPLVVAREVTMAEATLADSASDVDRVVRALSPLRLAGSLQTPKSAFPPVTPASPPVTPASPPVTPAPSLVTPAQAGGHDRLAGTESHSRGNDDKKQSDVCARLSSGGMPATPLTIDLHAARALPAVLRQNGWSLQARLRDGELIGVAPPGSRLFGLAVDLGTTNAAGFLVDLHSGVRVASLGIENPQAAWGGDVISRINHAVTGPAAAEELRAAAIEAVNALAHDLCQAVGATTADVVDVTICANTAMHHLLLGLPVRQLGRAPFVAALREAVDCKARDLGCAVAPGAYVHLAPNIGGFVGGDHVTALLATEDRWQDGAVTLVMDIGTNTEISLVHAGEILSASCPSGPALEGGHISCGMRAAEGAIERVFLEDGRIGVTVIGNHAPIGLCGSGVLDAVATLRRAGIVDDRGRVVADHPAVLEEGGGRAAVLAPGVYFSQHDVRAVQLAKAAIRTGVELLLAEAGLAEADIGRFIIAGAFGAYIDVHSGIAIGLFPDLPLDRFEQVGNAAGLGVRRMVASRRSRARARQIAARCRYLELSTRSEFQSRFIKNIGFNKHISERKAP